MRQKPKRKRPYSAQMMVTLKERQELKRNAARRNMTISGYMRYMTLGTKDDWSENAGLKSSRLK